VSGPGGKVGEPCEASGELKRVPRKMEVCVPPRRLVRKTLRVECLRGQAFAVCGVALARPPRKEEVLQRETGVALRRTPVPLRRLGNGRRGGCVFAPGRDLPPFAGTDGDGEGEAGLAEHRSRRRSLSRNPGALGQFLEPPLLVLGRVWKHERILLGNAGPNCAAELAELASSADPAAAVGTADLVGTGRGA